MRIRWQIPLALVVVAAGAGVAALLVALRPEVQAEPPQAPVPAVRVVRATRGPVDVVVHSEGTVEPRRESALVAEVSGRVTWTAASLVAGGFVRAGETLLRLDPTDAESAVAQAEAGVARAQLALERELAEQRVARSEWQALGLGEPDPLVVREPQVAEARAALEAARGERRRAGEDLERTRLRAPFDGRVRSETVDVGQFVSRGQSVAQLYAIDAAEVRLPVRDEDLAFLAVPLSAQARESGPDVALTAPLAGRVEHWSGRIVRTEGAIDPRTRLIHLVARVEDPYGLESSGGGAPLLAGLFVEARIDGVRLDDVLAVPRAALRHDDRLWIVDEDERLRVVGTEVVRRERERVLVRAGIDSGARVVVSPLEVAVDGMEVRVEGEDARLEAAGEGAAPEAAPEGRDG